MKQITNHGIERMKQRAGINEKECIVRAGKAYKRGMRAQDLTSWERDYLNGESHDNRIAVAYDTLCYIFEEETCITVFPLPAWFGKKKRFDGKTKIRNTKNYQRNYRPYDMDYVIA